VAQIRDEAATLERSGRCEPELVEAGTSAENGTRVPDSPHARAATGILAALGVSPDAGLDETEVRLRLALPLLPLQILFLNLVTDVFPAFALAMGEGGPDMMRRPPRDPTSRS
jgi:hypothetical protein